MDRAERLSQLAREVQTLAEEIRGDSDVEDVEGSARRLAHELRTHIGVALVLAESLARETGNDPLVRIDEDDSTGNVGHVSYNVVLDESDIADVEMQ